MRPVLIAAAGLLTVLAGLIGFASWSQSKAPEPDPAEWRPPCARALGQAYASIDVEVDERARRGRVFLFGVDRTPSNRGQSNEQLDAAVKLAGSLPVEDGVGILLVSDRSDRSSTPDLPFEPGVPGKLVRGPELPCGECRANSLFEQRCIEQVRAALEQRTVDRQAALDQAREQAARERADRLARWQGEVSTWWPRPGTSVLGFWRKVVDLPVVRRSPGTVTVVLFGDLQEARTRERRAIERYARAVADAGACTSENPLGERLDGVEVVLLQTVVDGIDPRRWEARWQTVLECAGAKVESYRYTPSVPLAEYLARR
jgi:hypothetical protein